MRKYKIYCLGRSVVVVVADTWKRDKDAGFVDFFVENPDSGVVRRVETFRKDIVERIEEVEDDT